MISTGPIEQAVTAEAFLRGLGIIQPDAEQLAISDGLLMAAQAVIEDGARRPFLSRAVEFQTRAGCGLRWYFPVCPITAVTAVDIADDAGDWVAQNLADVRLEMGRHEPQLVFADGIWSGYPDGAPVRIAATAGHSVIGDVRAQLVQAVHLIAGEWFRAGLTDGEQSEDRLSFGARNLVRQVRYVRPSEWAAS